MGKKQREAMKAAKQKFVGYVRVSTREQADEGVSLAAQEAKIRAMAAVRGVELVEIIADPGQSAKSLDRPGVQRLLGMIDRCEVGGILVAKLDRLTRSVRDLADLLERVDSHGLALVSAAESLDTSSAAGRLLVNIMGCMGQWEREIVAERTADGLGHLRATGKAYNHTPFGYRRIGDDLVADAAEQAIVAEIFRRRAAGDTLQAIADWLTETGTRTKQGGKWYPSTVAKILDGEIHQAQHGQA